MKKFLTLIIALFIFLTVFYVSLANNFEKINVMVNGEILDLNPYAVVTEGRTLVPFRAVLEKMGAKVYYNENTNTAIAEYDSLVVKIPLNDKYAVIICEGKAVRVEMGVLPLLIEDRLMVPLRFVSESLGFLVGYEESINTAIIINQDALFNIFSTSVPLFFDSINPSLKEKSYETAFNAQYSYTSPNHDIALSALSSGIGRIKDKNEYQKEVSSINVTKNTDPFYMIASRDNFVTEHISTREGEYLNKKLWSGDKWLSTKNNHPFKEIFREAIKDITVTANTYKQIEEAILLAVKNQAEPINKSTSINVLEEFTFSNEKQALNSFFPLTFSLHAAKNTSKGKVTLKLVGSMTAKGAQSEYTYFGVYTEKENLLPVEKPQNLQ